jgi:ketosteroid isomerase-like protein
VPERSLRPLQLTAGAWLVARAWVWSGESDVREGSMAEASAKEKVGEVVSRAKRRVGMESPRAAEADGRVGVVHGALKAFGSGDVDGFLDALDEDVQWEAPDGSSFPGGGAYSGRDAVRERFVDAVKRTYVSFGFRPDSFLDVDDEDAVLTVGRFQAEGVEGGNIDVAAAQLWELKGNVVKRVCIFTDSAPFPDVVSEEDAKERREQADQDSDTDERKESDDGGAPHASNDSDDDAPHASNASDDGDGHDADS